MTTPAVEFRDVTKRFSGVVANDGVSMSVEAGSVHALLGENGAGKTTLMNVLYGLYEPDEGTIHVRGDPRSFDAPRDAIDAGVGMIHQHFMLVDDMTVVENVTLGNEPGRWPLLDGIADHAGALATRAGIHVGAGPLGRRVAAVAERAAPAVDGDSARESVVELGERYGFDVDPDAVVEDVSVGVRQRVEILKALYRGADILVLDEPTAVLTPQEVEDLFSVLEELTARGKTVIFITHKLGEAMTAADAITVLRGGRNVGTVPAEATTREELAELMVGREVLLDVDRRPATPGEVVLEVADLAVTDDRGVRAVDGVSFDARGGEIFGIAGVDGNGQAELVEAITGLRTPESGRIRVDGREVTDESRRDRIDAGMAYVPADRQERGLVMAFDLVGNGVLGGQHGAPFARGGRMDWERAGDHARAVLAAYDVRPPDPTATAASLSGGNQQKFVVGRELERDPSLLVAAHPTRGVDVGSIEFIHDRLLSLRDEQVCTLLVSSKLEEVRTLSDRLAVINEGEFVDTVDPDAVTEEQLGLLLAGERPDNVSSTAAVTATRTGGDGNR
ncbi:heme ABC transporter ATP-binding protein [Halobacteriales archaeon QS_1_69_70]|nr:MAG: heme ABC transporter ATP-binding protein [Halobacteriales archaeon QS_1_69_70]